MLLEIPSSITIELPSITANITPIHQGSFKMRAMGGLSPHDDSAVSLRRDWWKFISRQESLVAKVRSSSSHEVGTSDDSGVELEMLESWRNVGAASGVARRVRSTHVGPLAGIALARSVKLQTPKDDTSSRFVPGARKHARRLRVQRIHSCMQLIFVRRHGVHCFAAFNGVV